VALSYNLNVSNLPPVPVIIWRDIFILVDKGNTKASDYKILERMVVEQSTKHSGGLGCLVIIPASASPPPDDVRQAIKDVLGRLAPKLRCLCWVVEGAGFRAAVARAVLTGLRVFSRQPYETHVANDMRSAVSWVLAHLTPRVERGTEVAAAVLAIQQGRGSAYPKAAADSLSA